MLGRRFERSTRCGARLYSINNKIVTFSFHSVSTRYGPGTFSERRKRCRFGPEQILNRTRDARASVVYKSGSRFIMCD